TAFSTLLAFSNRLLARAGLCRDCGGAAEHTCRNCFKSSPRAALRAGPTRAGASAKKTARARAYRAIRVVKCRRSRRVICGPPADKSTLLYILNSIRPDEDNLNPSGESSASLLGLFRNFLQSSQVFLYAHGTAIIQDTCNDQ